MIRIDQFPEAQTSQRLDIGKGENQHASKEVTNEYKAHTHFSLLYIKKNGLITKSRKQSNDLTLYS